MNREEVRARTIRDLAWLVRCAEDYRRGLEGRPCQHTLQDIELVVKEMRQLHGLAAPGTVMVENFDLASDVANHQVRVAGAESLSLAGFHGSLLKVYHKRSEELTRVEACFHRVNLDMGEVGRLLNELATPPYNPGLFPSLDPREVA